MEDPLGISKITEEILNHARKEKAEQEKSTYYARCPNCGKRQVKKNLLKEGCFVCGWEGEEEEIKLAQAKRRSIGGKEKGGEYRSSCPNCGAQVVTEEFKESGCWKCGYGAKRS